VTIAPDTPLIAAAKRLDEAKVKRLPAVDERGRLVGIVARGDLLRVYLRPDREIAEEVRGEVLRRTLWVEPGQIEVEVRDGGGARRAARAGGLPPARLAGRPPRLVAGVAAVVERPEREFDDRGRADGSPDAPAPWGLP